MVIYCFVPKCNSSGTSGFHSFPTDPERRLKWVLATKTQHLRPKERQKVCIKHFKESDLLTDIDGKRRLVENAVPCLFLPNSSMLDWDHNYASGNEHVPTKCSFKRVKRTHLQEDESNKQVNESNGSNVQVNGLNGHVNESKRQTNESIPSVEDIVGSEVEIDAFRFKKQVDLGDVINVAFVNSLQEKLLLCKEEKSLLATKLRNCKNQVKRLQRKAKDNKLNDDKVLEYLHNKKKYSSAQLQFQRMQLRNAGRKSHGRRYFPNEKSFCLALYKCGPRSYRFQEGFNILPALSTLARHSAKLMFRAGISPQLFAFIKELIKDWSEEDLCCILSFDETALKTRLQHNKSTDEIDGFVELAGIRKPIFATHALTFMVRGIKKAFKQPVAFYYTHGLKSYELAELIILVLEALLATGLDVIGTVSDQTSINESSVHQLMQRHFPRYPGCLLKFNVQGRTIIHCYDLPHLLKVERNNLQVKNLVHFISKRWNFSTTITFGKEKVASWADVVNLYEQDRIGIHRLLPKIKDEHIDPKKLKMKVCVATQVFSQTFGTVMLRAVEKKQLHGQADGTAQILLFFNDLFDSLNGSGPVQSGTLKGSINQHSIHFNYWEYALVMLSKMKFVNIETGKAMTRSTVLYKFMATIRGYQEITRICLLDKNIKEVSLRNCDSDGLENLFGVIKSNCQIACTPTLSQFRSGYTTSILNNLTGAKPLATNCEPDSSVAMLNNIHDLIQKYNSSAVADVTESMGYELYDDIVYDVQFSNRDISSFESQSLSNSSSLICATILKELFCESCQSLLQGSSDEGHSYPSENFKEKCQKIFKSAMQIIPIFCSEKLVKKVVISEIKKILEDETEVKLGCMEHSNEIADKLYQSTLDYALILFCKNINDILTGKIKSLPLEPNVMQELAWSFWAKNSRIAKHSDIFKLKE